MKFVIEQAAFIGVLEHVRGVVEKRNTIPILSNVLLQASKGKITLIASDLDIEITESVDAAVETAGSVTVQAHLLHDIVRKSPKGSQVSVESKTAAGGSIEVKAGRSKFALATLPVEDFPNMACGALGTTFALPAATLRAAIDKVTIAISTEETRYYLNGFYMHETGGDIRIVSTDGHRLVRHQIEAPDGSKDMPGVIVPRKTAGELRRLLDGVDDDVAIEMSDTKARFSFGNTVLLSKLIDGTYPPYDRVIPQNNTNIMTMVTADLIGIIDRAATILPNGRAICMTPKAGTVLFSAANSDGGNVAEDADAEFSGKELTIGFNHKYLLGFANQIEGGNTVFEMSDAGSPAVIRDSSDPRTLYVLMPLRV